MMLVKMILGLKDVPGMLLKALEPISSSGGNILSVVHMRSRQSVVGVHISFNVADQNTLNRILSSLKKGKFEIKDVQVEGRRYFSKKSISFILLGHVIDSDIQDTIDSVNELGLVSDVDVRMRDPDEESAVLMRVNVDEEKYGTLIDRVGEISEKKGFLFISEV